MLMLAARAGPGPTPAGHANRAYEVFGRHKGCLSLFHRGSCLAEPLWMRHKAKHGNEKQIRKACKDF